MGNLFDDDDDGAPARRGDPHTSFGHHDRETLSRLRRALLDYMEVVKEATELDAQIHFKDHGSTYRARFIELERKGFIHRTGRVKHQISPGKTRSTARQIWRIGPAPLPLPDDVDPIEIEIEVPL